MDQDKSVGALFGVPGEALWTQQAGGAADDSGHAIANDHDNNLIIVGQFRGIANFGSVTLTSAGADDVFVAKLDGSTGNVLWAKRFGGTDIDNGVAVSTDDAGSIYVTGTFIGTATFDGGSIQSAGGSDAFILKLNSAGDYIWAQQLGGADTDEGKAIAVHGNTVVVAGSYQTAMIVNGMTMSSIGAEDVFVLKLTTDGVIGWAKSLGGAGTDVPTCVAVDGNNNVVLSGRFSGTTSLGGSPLAAVGYEDVFVAKYAGSTGEHLFSKSFGSTYFDAPTSIAVDSSGDILILGYYSNAMDVGGPSPLPQGTTVRTFLLKYSLAGAFIWAKSLGDPGALGGSSIDVNAAGDVAVTGHFCGTINLGGSQMSSVRSCADYDQDIFVARFSGIDGAYINSMRAGGTGLDGGNGVVQIAAGRTFVIGSFGGFAEFGGQGLTSNGGSDVVVLSLAPL